MYRNQSYSSDRTEYGSYSARPAHYGAQRPAYWSSAPKPRLVEYTGMGGSKPYQGGDTSPSGGGFQAWRVLGR